ncbi:zinc metalloprotease HtpX [Nitrosomonas sp. Is37]|uniref:zinc metalloprotease HtpX n=1 Tax=Nitrosomonas sp. Is37 TaxID=3080535 RepID=UPI00294B60EF|nr:zinc metalloprotease HtpX [Nitrosomonas sp. Is37]MDV6343334.1 zinc metalloprotease HtpX [Nitrosomonas sp. Is37]
MLSIRAHSWVNRLQTFLLICLLLGIFILAGWLLFGKEGLWLIALISVIIVLIQPAVGSRLTLVLYRARPITRHEAPELWHIIAFLAARAELPNVPTLYYVESPMVNAFTVGNRRQAAIALTDGLLRYLSIRELAAVLAHETAHVANGDLIVMGLADYISRLTSMLALAGQILLFFALPSVLLGYATINWPVLLLLLFSPHLTLLLQLGLSRVREFHADLKASELTGDPEALALALARIERASRSWRAWLFPGWGNPQPSWLRTHPATEERIKRLLSLRATSNIRWSAQPLSYTSHERVRSSPRWYFNGFWR